MISNHLLFKVRISLIYLFYIFVHFTCVVQKAIAFKLRISLSYMPACLWWGVMAGSTHCIELVVFKLSSLQCTDCLGMVKDICLFVFKLSSLQCTDLHEKCYQYTCKELPCSDKIRRKPSKMLGQVLLDWCDYPF